MDSQGVMCAQTVMRDPSPFLHLSLPPSVSPFIPPSCVSNSLPAHMRFSRRVADVETELIRLALAMAPASVTSFTIYYNAHTDFRGIILAANC